MTLKERIEKIFKYYGIDYHCDYNNNAQQVTITIMDANPETHSKLVEIMDQNGFECIDTYITSGDETTYDAEHTFQLN